MTIAELIATYRDAITDAVLRAYPPLYDAAARRTSDFNLRRLVRRPLGAQADAIRATGLSLQRQRGTIMVGEMGCGKTYIAAAAAYLAGCRRVFVLCPSHLLRKWRRELEQTVPGAGVAIVRTIRDLERVRHMRAPVHFVVCSKEHAKLGYRWRPAVVSRVAREPGGALARDEGGGLVCLLCCPACFTPSADEEGVPLEWEDLAQKKRICEACGGPLWQADRTGPRRVPLADYVLRRMPGLFDLLIVDEVHELKGKGTAQGLAGASLAEACGKTLVLSGTLLGGYASTLFHILYRFSPAVRAEFAHDDEAKWVSRYGYVARITKRDQDQRLDDGRQSKRRSYLTRVVEKPGVMPSILLQLLGTSLFLRLGDVADHLPPYQERVMLVPLDAEALLGDLSQRRSYQQLATDLRRAVQQALRAGSKRLLGTYLQVLLSYPDACWRQETVVDPLTNDVLAHAPALPDDRLYPKERALVDLVRREKGRGRRVLIFATHTNLRDITPRLRQVLEREGFRVAVLKADTVPAERREDWVAARVREGIDVMVTNPKIVQTGLDLIAFPSTIWTETDFSVYTVRQASRRAWRVGQAREVEITHLVYEGTLQAEALALVAAKTRASLMVEGELPEEGLAALEGDGGDVYLSLARRRAGTGDEGRSHAQSLEALFAEARQRDDDDDRLLVDEGWEDDVDLRPSPSHVRSEAATLGPVTDLPLFASIDGVAPPLNDTRQSGKVLTFEELAGFLRRRRSRTKPVLEGQLPLFGL